MYQQHGQSSVRAGRAPALYSWQSRPPQMRQIPTECLLSPTTALTGLRCDLPPPDGKYFHRIDKTQKFLGMSAVPGHPALQGRDVDERCSTMEGEGEIPRAGNVTPASQRLSASQAPLRNATASESQPRRMHVYTKLH